MENNFKHSFIVILVTSVLVSSIFGGIMGYWAGAQYDDVSSFWDWFFGKEIDGNVKIIDGKKVVTVEEESAVISAVEEVSPAVVSIIVTKDLPIIERFYSDPFGSDFFNNYLKTHKKSPSVGAR